MNYNLPPWLVIKRYFMMLALIIPSKESVTSENVDVHLESLVEELQILWKGVKALDSFQGATFNLRAMCMWNIHDFPAYGLFVGCVTKGLVGCPPCGPTIKYRHSRKFKKVV